MLLVSKMIGLPVVEQGSNETIGRVKNILFSKNRKNIRAVLIKMPHSLKTFIAYFEDISDIKNNLIEVNDKSAIRLYRKRIRKFFKRIFSDYNEIVKKNVKSVEGDRLGFVNDFFINEYSGRIEVMKISKGLFDDILKGRIMMPLSWNTEISDEITIDRESLEEIGTGEGGIINKIKRNNNIKE